MTERILEVNDLHVSLILQQGSAGSERCRFYLNKGETLAIVGESGSGKSVTTKQLQNYSKGTQEELKGRNFIFREDLAKNLKTT